MFLILNYILYHPYFSTFHSSVKGVLLLFFWTILLFFEILHIFLCFLAKKSAGASPRHTVSFQTQNRFKFRIPHLIKNPFRIPNSFPLCVLHSTLCTPSALFTPSLLPLYRPSREEFPFVACSIGRNSSRRQSRISRQRR